MRLRLIQVAPGSVTEVPAGFVPIGIAVRGDIYVVCADGAPAAPPAADTPVVGERPPAAGDAPAPPGETPENPEG